VRDFTVIEGGGRGPDDPLDIDARHHLRRLVIEILRTLARGNDPEARIARELVEFSRTASRMSTPLHQIVDQLLAELSAELEPEGRDHIHRKGSTNMTPPVAWQTFAGFFLAALGVGMGWALGNWIILMLARLVTLH
jgi:hypothetical protein